jgi:hypothetical protein
LKGQWLAGTKACYHGTHGARSEKIGSLSAFDLWLFRHLDVRGSLFVAERGSDYYEYKVKAQAAKNKSEFSNTAIVSPWIYRPRHDLCNGRRVR